jgi:thiamine monophosphate kinase
MGETPQGQALRRDARKVGDDVWVSGELGLGAIAVAIGQLADAGLSEDVLAACQCKLDFPVPRLELGQALLAWHMRRPMCRTAAGRSGAYPDGLRCGGGNPG